MATLPVFSEPAYLRIVRASGWYDLLVTWPCALPWTFAWLYAPLSALALALGLPGTLLGSVVVVWSIARIVAPSLLLGRLDGVARFLFAAWQIYAVAHGANAVVLGFTAFELLFGVLQWWRVRGAGLALCPPGPSINARAQAAA